MSIMHRSAHEPTDKCNSIGLDVVYYTSILRVPSGVPLGLVEVPPSLLNVQHTEGRIVSPILPIERFDAIDAATGEYVVMFRVPYHTPHPQRQWI